MWDNNRIDCLLEHLKGEVVKALSELLDKRRPVQPKQVRWTLDVSRRLPELPREIVDHIVKLTEQNRTLYVPLDDSHSKHELEISGWLPRQLNLSKRMRAKISASRMADFRCIEKIPNLDFNVDIRDVMSRNDALPGLLEHADRWKDLLIGYACSGEEAVQALQACDPALSSIENFSFFPHSMDEKSSHSVTAILKDATARRCSMVTKTNLYATELRCVASSGFLASTASMCLDGRTLDGSSIHQALLPLDGLHSLTELAIKDWCEQHTDEGCRLHLPNLRSLSLQWNRAINSLLLVFAGCGIKNLRIGFSFPDGWDAAVGTICGFYHHVVELDMRGGTCDIPLSSGSGAI